MRYVSFVLSALLIFLFIGGTNQSEAQSKVKMKYLVIGEFIDRGQMMSPKETQEMANQVIFPSLDRLAKWDAENKISGGVYLAERKGVFLVEASSNEEVDKMILSLPFWGLLKWEVYPLNSYADRLAYEKMMVKEMQSKQGEPTGMK